MSEFVLPPSPSWYCSRVCDANEAGVFVYGCRHEVFVFDAQLLPPKLTGAVRHSDRVSGLALEPRGLGLCCSCSEDGKVNVWEVKSRVITHQHWQHKAKVTAVSWSGLQRDLIVSGDDKGFIVSWKFHSETFQCMKPEKNAIFSMACSTQNAEVVAVGYKSGLILLIDLAKKGDIIHKLRGHDDEVQSLVWCPVPGETLETCNKEQGLCDNVLAAPGEEASGCLLASGCKDQTIRLWSTSQGRFLAVLKLPPNPGYRKERQFDDQGKSKLWLTLHWLRGCPQKIVSSSFGGQLLLWNLSLSDKKHKSFMPVEGKGHARSIFNICASNENTLITTSLDRQVIFWDLATCTSKFVLPTLGGFAYAVQTSLVDPGRLAIGVGDNMIRLWNLESAKCSCDVTCLWQGIKSKVTSLCWHPTKEGLLAYGTDDGRVGIYETLSNRAPGISSTYHKGTVYVVVWGPPCYATMPEKTAEHTVYSVGDGIILQHNPASLKDAAQNVNLLIGNTNEETKRFLIRSEISWKSDFLMVAIGNDDGSVELYKPPNFRLVCVVHVHQKLINCIRWHPIFTADVAVKSQCCNWIAIGSNDSAIHVVDLSLILDQSSSMPTGKLVVADSMRKLDGHSRRITGLCWSTHNEGHIVSASYDGTAQVWNVITGKILARFVGHRGKLLCALWSLTDADVIYTGADDYTVHRWRVSDNLSDGMHSSGKTKKKKKIKSLKSPAAGSLESIAYDVNNISGDDLRTLEHLLAEKRKELSEAVQYPVADARDFLSSVTNTFQKQQGKLVHLTDCLEEVDRSCSEVTEHLTTPERQLKERSSVKETDLPARERRKKRAKSFFPLSNKKENCSSASALEDVLMLARRIYDYKPEFSLTEFHLALFLDRRDTYRLLKEEGQYHLEHDNMEYYLQMEVWKGNVSSALKIAQEREELSDWLVAMAPLASHKTWLTACEEYAQQLEHDGQYHKAATYLMASHRVYEAIDLFRRHRLFREAIAFAKLRLSPVDPVLEELYSVWAQQLTKDGNYEQAAKCYLAIKQVKDAARVLARRSDHMCLRTAAHVSLLGLDQQNGLLYAQKVLFQYLQQHQYQQANSFIQEHSSLQVLLLLTSVHESLIHELMILAPGVISLDDTTCFSVWNNKLSSGKSLLPDFILDMGEMDPVFPWQPHLINGHTFLHHMLRVWYQCLDISFNSNYLDEAYRVFSNLVATRQSQVDVTQLLIWSSMDLVLCLLALLHTETTAAIKHLLQACTSLHEAGQYRFLLALSRLCLPQGPKYLLKLQQEVTAVRVMISMDTSDASFDSSVKMQSTKRYLSELKDGDGISNTGHRCRELDCVRAYFYMAALYYCVEEQHHQKKLSENSRPMDSQAEINCTHSGDMTAVENSKNPEKLSDQTNNNVLLRKSDLCLEDGTSFKTKDKMMYELDFEKLRYISRSVLWDIQAKRFALTEKLGYIHKALSQLLLNQKPKGEKISHVADGKDSGITDKSLESAIEHNRPSSGTSDVCLKTLLPTPDVIPTGHESTVANQLDNNSNLSVRENALPAVTSPLTQQLCCYVEESKQRKVFWDDEPPQNCCHAVHHRYTNIPDEWYTLPADERYSQPYVTVAMLREEQEAVMVDLKQGPENPLQILFPNPLETAQLLVNVAWQSDKISTVDKVRYADSVVSWALRYSVTKKQCQVFLKLNEQGAA